MRKTVILLLILTSFVLGCSDDKVKPSEDYLLTTKAIENIEAIVEAYENKHRAVLKSRMASGPANTIMENLSFMKAELAFTTRLVNIKESSVIININWQGSWTIDKKRTVENRGAAELILDKESLQLVRIEGDSPFTIPLLRSH